VTGERIDNTARRGGRGGGGVPLAATCEARNAP